MMQVVVLGSVALLFYGLARRLKGEMETWLDGFKACSLVASWLVLSLTES